MKDSQTWAVSAVVFAILETTADDLSAILCCLVIAASLSMMTRAAVAERAADREAPRA